MKQTEGIKRRSRAAAPAFCRFRDPEDQETAYGDRKKTRNADSLFRLSAFLLDIEKGEGKWCV